MKFLVTGCTVVLLLAFFACNPSNSSEEPGNQVIPTPSLFSISPESRVMSLPSFTLTAVGDHFVEGSVIVFNGKEKETAFINQGVLTCVVNSGDLGAEGAMDGISTVTVSVRNPGTEYKVSQVLEFTVYENYVFTTRKKLEPNGENIGYYRPKIAVDEPGSIHVVYHFYDAYTNSNPAGISYIHSDDGGETWTTPVTLERGDGLTFNPSLAVSADGTINVVYIGDGRVRLIQSVDGGFTWKDPVSLSGTALNFSDPTVMIDDEGGLNVSWGATYKKRYFAVYFMRSVDGGVSWTEPVNIFNGWDDSSTVFDVNLTPDGKGGVYASWTAMSEYGRKNASHVFTNYSHNRGITWNYTDTSFGTSWRSDIGVDKAGDRIYAAIGKIFQDYDYRVVLLESTDRGISWGREVIVTTGGGETRPSMEIDGAGNINLAYHYWDEFYFLRSVDRGTTWSETKQLFEDASELQMAMDARGNLYFICSDVENSHFIFRRSIY